MTRTTEPPTLTDGEAVVIRFMAAMAHGDVDGTATQLGFLGPPPAGADRSARVPRLLGAEGRGPLWLTRMSRGPSTK